MKLRKVLLLSALVATPIVGMVACGGDNGKDDGAGGARATTSSNADAIRKLEAEIAALKDQLASGDVPVLRDALEEAQEQLNKCYNGGECTGYSEATEALAQITDAYCEYAFNCCDENAARATLGTGADTLEKCQALYRSGFERGNASLDFPGFGSFESEQVAQYGESVQRDRLRIDGDAIAACLGQMTSQCGDEDPVILEPVCGAEPDMSCADSALIIGLQQYGEPCNVKYTFSECEPGLQCVRANDGNDGNNSEGICLRAAAEGDACQGDNDCQDTDGILYCDEHEGSCKVRPAGGEDCKFEDSRFFYTTALETPCQPGFFCSPETLKCEASCDGQPEGDLCLVNDSYCGEDAYCDGDYDADVEDSGTLGKCREYLAPGTQVAGTTDYTAADCRNGATHVDTSVVPSTTHCDYPDRAACEASGECLTGYCDIYTDTCAPQCSYDNQCESGEQCLGGRCRAGVGNGAACQYNEQCPEHQWCSAGTCVADYEDGDSCSNQFQCEAGTYCDTLGTGECVTEGGRAANEDCNDWYQCASGRCDLDNGTCLAASALKQDGDSCTLTAGQLTEVNYDPCANGLFCKRNNPDVATDLTGVCTAQIETGRVCDQSQSTAIPQCAGNATCAYNSDMEKSICPVPATDFGVDDACVISQFSQNTW